MASMARVFEQIPSARLISTAPAFTEESLAAAGMRDKIIHLGRQPYERLSVVLGAGDVLALPLADNASNRARWPNKIGDYLAAGRPVATCAVGDVADLFATDSPIGAASAPTPEAFADAMLGLLSRPEAWASLSASARNIAEKRMDWQCHGRTVEAFLQSLLAND
jgi:glycosyltransferase involved in cell wall biosynthesis